MSTMSAGTGGGGGPPSSIMEGKIPVFVFPVQLGTRIHSVLDGTYRFKWTFLLSFYLSKKLL